MAIDDKIECLEAINNIDSCPSLNDKDRFVEIAGSSSLIECRLNALSFVINVDDGHSIRFCVKRRRFSFIANNLNKRFRKIKTKTMDSNKSTKPVTNTTTAAIIEYKWTEWITSK